MSGLSTRDFGTREDAVITDLEAAGTGSDTHTAMGLLKGMVSLLSDALEALDTLATAEVASTGYVAKARFQAVAAAIGAGDVLGGVKIFGGIGPEAGGEVMLTSTALQIETSAVISGETSYQLYLYKATPDASLIDNAVFDIPSADRDNLIAGPINLGTPVDIGSTLRIETDVINKQMTIPPGGKAYGLLVTVGAFTATAFVREVTLHTVAL